MQNTRMQETEHRTALLCPVVPGKLLARIDQERQRLYLWCKACKCWHTYDLKTLDAVQHP